MRYARARSLIFCVFLTATTLSQADEISGYGTPGYIPHFTGTQRLANSNIFQAGAELGVNTTSPQATLDVESTDTFAVMGSTSSSGNFATGVIGRTASSSGNGVDGEATSTTGGNGVFGRSAGTSGIGVSGLATATTGNAYGAMGQTYTTGFGAGVLGSANATTGNAFGVFGSSASPDGVAMFGVASATSGNSTAIVGVVDSTTGGVAGRFVTGGGAGLVLQGLSGSNGTQVFSVDAHGNGFFAGNLSKASGSFKIDHPLDPANKYLSHSFVESPDMMDVYNGVVVLDKRGSAWVELPEYFQALNRDYRYQLTSLGAPGPNLYIAEEVTGNRFKISGGKPSGKVSWQVTGIRQDAYANAHRIAVEEAKPLEARGQYLHPELFGAPKERAIAALH